MPNTLEVLINGEGNIVLKNDKRGGPGILLSSKFLIILNTSNTKPLLAIVCLEPLAGSAPKFPTSATDNLIFPMQSELSLSCAAQGYPLPQIR